MDTTNFTTNLRVATNGVATKFCRGCGEYHAATKEVFGSDSRAADGLKSPCKLARKRQRNKVIATKRQNHDKHTTRPKLSQQNHAKPTTKITTNTTRPNLLSKFVVMLVFFVAAFIRINNGAAGLGGNSIVFVGDWFAWLASSAIIAGVTTAFLLFKRKTNFLTCSLWLCLEALALGVDGIGVVYQIDYNKQRVWQEQRTENIESIDREYREQARIAAMFDTRDKQGEMVRLREEAQETFYPALRRMQELSTQRTELHAEQFELQYAIVDCVAIVVWLFAPILTMLAAIWFRSDIS